MDGSYLVRGVALGFSIAAPVGPIGVLCIRRTLADGRAAGFVSGLGAATADALYGAMAGFGLSAVARLLVGQRLWLQLVGGLFLCYLGLKTFMARPATAAATAQGHGLLGAYASTFLLTLTNPLTILSFAAVFAGAGLTTGATPASAALLIAGVFTGSTLWWLLLSGGTAVFRARVTPSRLRLVNRLSGTIIATFGVIALLHLFV